MKMTFDLDDEPNKAPHPAPASSRSIQGVIGEDSLDSASAQEPEHRGNK